MKLEVSKVEASDSQIPNVPENTLDGDVNTRWSAQGEQEIIYDLAGVQRVKYISLAFMRGNVRTANFDLFLSRDGNDWTKVLSGQSSGLTEDLETYQDLEIHLSVLHIV